MKPAALACLVLASLVAFTQPGPAQEAIASPAGWAPWRNPATGTLYFQCEAKACGQGSTVSTKPQQNSPLGSLVDYQTRTEKADQALVTASRGAYVSAKIVKLYAKDVGSIRAQIAVRALSRTDRQVEHIASAIASDGRNRFSLVSTGPSESSVRTNLESFLVLPFITSTLNAPKPKPR